MYISYRIIEIKQVFVDTIPTFLDLQLQNLKISLVKKRKGRSLIRNGLFETGLCHFTFFCELQAGGGRGLFNLNLASVICKLGGN